MAGPSLGYPRLVYVFSDGGNASLFATDPGIDVTFLVDNLDTAGHNFSNASDNAA